MRIHFRIWIITWEQMAAFIHTRITTWPAFPVLKMVISTLDKSKCVSSTHPFTCPPAPSPVHAPHKWHVVTRFCWWSDSQATSIRSSCHLCRILRRRLFQTPFSRRSTQQRTRAEWQVPATVMWPQGQGPHRLFLKGCVGSWCLYMYGTQNDIGSYERYMAG